uniref:RING-type domain-containing protein n=1 Tax=Graphocephala atropunctata TaxID=36148 RepID=A0A1B6M9H3_9HEMI
MDIIKCAVCMETVTGSNVVLCVNEHMICGCCAQKLAKCPTCAQPFSTLKPQRPLTQILEALPHSCRHNCGKVLTRDDDHETYCVLRQTQCKVCDEMVPGRDMYTHVTTKHPSTTAFTEKYFPSRYTNFKQNKPVKCISIHNVSGHIFWEVILNDPVKQVLTKSYQYIPNGKPNCAIFIENEFNSAGTVFMSKFQLNPNPEVDIQKENIVIIPTFMLSKFMVKDDLKYKVNVTLI